MIKKVKLASATLAALFCLAATAGPAAAERFGSCEIHDKAGSKSKKSANKGKAKHKGGKHR
jgi:hypothetical protein